MGEIPDGSNFFASLHTSLSRRQVAELFAPLGWRVRRCSWTDYEVIGPFAKLVIEAESPMLLHGPLADVQENAEQVLAVLRVVEIAYTVEIYDAGGGLLREYRWGPPNLALQRTRPAAEVSGIIKRSLGGQVR